MSQIAILCVLALGVLVFGLGLGVSLNRQKLQKSYGVGDDPSSLLYRFSRAHGNTIEYAPYLAILMLFHGAHAPAVWLEVVMIAATLSRYLLAAGLIFYPSMNRTNGLRFIGAVGTYTAGVILSVSLLIYI